MYCTGCSGETVITKVESSIVGFPWIGELDTFSLDFLLQFGKALGSTTGYGSVSTNYWYITKYHKLCALF